jgi:energy-dependent translational throttle protein EttA
MAQFIYTMNRVGKVVPPKRVILRDISLSFFPGAKIGVLGLNGSGKSTLLRIMAGIDKEFEGEARPQPGIQIGFLQQEPQLDETKDVRGNVEKAVQHIKDALAGLDAVYAAYAEPDADFDKIAAEQARLEAIIQAADGHNLERQLEVAADALRLPPWDADVTKISGGERRRVALCQLLLSKPDMLLLDEPTNHLDAESVALARALPRELPRHGHRRDARSLLPRQRRGLDPRARPRPRHSVAGQLLVLARAEGKTPAGRGAAAGSALKKMLARELEWVRQNPKARQAKSKARMQRFEELQSRDFQERNETNEIYIPPGPRLGELVIEAKGLSKSYGEKLLFDNLNFNLPQGGIVGIIGPNGAGKTTLFRIITGKEQPDGGEIRIGPSVQLAYVDQSRQSLDDKKTVWAEISNGLDTIKVGNYETPSRAYVGRFNFRGSQQQQSIGELSGGERNRVHLAKVLKEGGNVILLDEPTNDLDIETLRALEEALLSFPGCAVVISHDRWFLDRIATHILAFEGNSEVIWFEGNYSEYVDDLKKRRGEDAEQPHRVRFRSLHA